jgi:hypothetical protein
VSGLAVAPTGKPASVTITSALVVSAALGLAKAAVTVSAGDHAIGSVAPALTVALSGNVGHAAAVPGAVGRLNAPSSTWATASVGVAPASA